MPSPHQLSCLRVPMESPERHKGYHGPKQQCTITSKHNLGETIELTLQPRSIDNTPTNKYYTPVARRGPSFCSHRVFTLTEEFVLTLAREERRKHCQNKKQDKTKRNGTRTLHRRQLASIDTTIRINKGPAHFVPPFFFAMGVEHDFRSTKTIRALNSHLYSLFCLVDTSACM